MKLPIPQDWNGETWQCVNILWPKSETWLSILAGLVTMPTRGRLWDETSGSIKDAQAIGRQIDIKNLPFTLCATCPEQIVDAVQGGSFYVSGDCGDCEDCDMGNCSIPYGALRWNSAGTNLEYLYCGEWYEVGGDAPIQVGEKPVFEIPDYDTDETSLSRCAMAEGVASALIDLAGYIWDEADNTLPVFMPTKAKNHTGLDLWTVSIVNATTLALVMKGVIVYSTGTMNLAREEVLPSDLQGKFECQLFNVMSDDGTAEPDVVYDTFWAVINSEFPLAADAENPFIRNYWSHIGSAIGKGTMRDIAVNSALNEPVGDCSCPGTDLLATVPTANGWYLSAPLSYQASPSPLVGDGEMNLLFRNIPVHDVYGVVFEVAVDGTYAGRVKRAGSCAYATYTYDVCMNLATSDNLTDGQVYAQMDTGIRNELVAAGILPSSTVTLASGGRQSNVVGSPVALGTQVTGFKVLVEGDAGTSFTAEMTGRWLHNSNSPSHS